VCGHASIAAALALACCCLGRSALSSVLAARGAGRFEYALVPAGGAMAASVAPASVRGSCTPAVAAQVEFESKS